MKNRDSTLSAQISQFFILHFSFLSEGLVRVDLLLVERERDFLVPQWHILAQRMALPIIRHQDAVEARVSSENNPEQIVGFALLPVGGRPQPRKGSNRRVALRQADFETYTMAVRMREHVVDDLEAWVAAQIIDRSEERRVGREASVGWA